MVEVLSERLAQLDDAVAASSAANTPDERACQIGKRLADIMVDHRQRYSIMMNDPTVRKRAVEISFPMVVNWGACKSAKCMRLPTSRAYYIAVAGADDSDDDDGDVIRHNDRC